MYKLCFFVPESHLEPVKQAVFAAGGGRIGDYEHCCWQVLGQGQFRPGQGADPFIGTTGELETVAEYRVDLVCADELIAAAVAALKQAHPYEEPAYDVWRLADF
ncbi:Putative GTP cyclohydrolase 1 type 2 [Pseudomonas saudimassiliensis]|uniref:Putative GTP cyclohydrolase 1 type 2 n=1 Tax=Pseudomonas saudimassiliensis TaxID=1461581 RepID=A0A078M3V1_9PSED|nr:YqfO family protein [Pseudomonas saudimassiliensis]CEA00929.1 Putative GTP cyclohydrolase 1 type 2 [Pseudomonas saudimassiliensis]CEF25329.1 Putative GTP cyclohydrolase 1 type 2 [Pseudomonas saudimassiliensis]